MKAPVYINYGRFVVDCPCGDAREVQPGERTTACVDGHPLDMEWPADAAALMTALAERISVKRRNWFPRLHPLALQLGKPHGQTPDELRRETETGEAADAAALTDRRAALLAEMKDAGITADEALAALKGV
jgi:hypothetical protein